MRDEKQNTCQRAGIAYTKSKTEIDTLAQIAKLETRLDYLLSGLRAGIDMREAECRHPTFWDNVWGRNA